jgi:hypothetical protein
MRSVRNVDNENQDSSLKIRLKNILNAILLIQGVYSILDDCLRYLKGIYLGQRPILFIENQLLLLSVNVDWNKILALQSTPTPTILTGL